MVESTMKFLWMASTVIPRPRPEKHPALSTLCLLRSHILTKWKTAVLKQEVPDLPNILRKSSMCSLCSCTLKGSSQIKVKPKKNPSKRIKRIVNKYNLSGEFNFTKHEKALWRKYQSNIGNKLILTCMSCRNKTTIPMRKPPLLENSEKELTSEKPAKKKKKKLKDPLAGLKMSVAAIRNSSIVGPKLKKDAQVKWKPNQNQKLAQDNQTVNLKVSTLRKHPWETVPVQNPVDFNSKKFKKCNKLAEILAKSSNTKPSSQKLKTMNMLNSLQVMLRKKNL